MKVNLKNGFLKPDPYKQNEHLTSLYLAEGLGRGVSLGSVFTPLRGVPWLGQKMLCSHSAVLSGAGLAISC